MSQLAYHWEALRKQRVIDRKSEALKRMAEREAQEHARRSEAAAKEEREKQKRESSRQKMLKEQIKEKDWSALKKTNDERNREIDRLLQEQKWHNNLIARMEQQEKDHLMAELLRDHYHKAKILRDHGLYRGHPSFFTDPKFESPRAEKGSITKRNSVLRKKTNEISRQQYWC